MPKLSLDEKEIERVICGFKEVFKEALSGGKKVGELLSMIVGADASVEDKVLAAYLLGRGVGDQGVSLFKYVVYIKAVCES